MRDPSLLNDRQWEVIKALLPKARRRRKRGRPRAEERMVLEGILWVLRSGARWRDLPREYPSASTCWRRLQEWEERDDWLRIWRALLEQLDARGKLNWDEVFLEGSFASAKKGGSAWVKPNVARAQSGWWWQTARVFLLGSQLTSASPAEVTLAEAPLARISVPRRPRPPAEPPAARHLPIALTTVIRCGHVCSSAASSCFARIGANGAVLRGTMAVRCAATKDAGKLSAPLPTWETSAVSSFVTNASSPSIKASFT